MAQNSHSLQKKDATRNRCCIIFVTTDLRDLQTLALSQRRLENDFADKYCVFFPKSLPIGGLEPFPRDSNDENPDGHLVNDRSFNMAAMTSVPNELLA